MAFTSIEDLIKNSSGLGPSLAMNAPVEAPPGEIPLALRDANPQPIAPPPPPMAKAAAPKKTAQKEVSEAAVKEEEAPQEAPNPYADLMVTKDDLEKAADAKKEDIGLGMMMDAFANRQSWGNFYSGKMGPHHDVTSGFKQMAEMEDQPIKNKQLLLAQELKRPETEMQARMTDPNSVESKLSRDLAVAGISKLNLPGETKQKLLESIKSANALQVNSLVDKNPMLKDVFQQDAMGQRMLMMGRMFQTRQDNMDRSFGLKEAGLGLREAGLGMRANNSYSHEMKQTEDQLLGANRALELVRKIKSNDLVGTSQLKSDLSASLASMMNGGRPATVYGMSHQDFDSLYARAQHSYGILSGQTPGTITDAQLTQLQKDIEALQKEYSKQREIKFKSFQSGSPDQFQGKLQKRYDQFGQTMGEQQGKPSGKVKVSNGKDSFFVSPQDAVEALRDGFKVVE
jgi:hypothetical protein